MEHQLIKEQTLKELIASGAVQNAVVMAHGPGFAVLVRYGASESSLANKQGEPRLFASLDTVVPFLKKLGLPKFEVDATEHEPGRLRKARPDRSEALKRTRTVPHQPVLI
jgi:hypothetical protein